MKPLIIAGFHRSGTSATALYLRACGLAIGDELLGANASNPLGHGEDFEIRRFHDRLLHDNGQSWIVADPFVPAIAPARWNEMRKIVAARALRSQPWGFKDPRVCLFLPLWRHVLPDAKVLILFRSPRDCAFSLARRHASELLSNQGNRTTHMRFFAESDLALRMWLLHNRRLIEFARAHAEDVLVLGFEALLAGFPLVRQINARWNLDLAPLNPAITIRPEFLNGAPMQTRIGDGDIVAPLIATWSELRALEQRTIEASGTDHCPGSTDMSKNDFKVDADPSQLRMENELLAFEVAFLRQTAKLAPPDGVHAATRAEARLKKLLGRIDASPFGWYFRRKKWFRKAQARRAGA